MSEYIVELDSKHSIALKIAFAEEMRGGDFIRGEIVRCRDCKYRYGCVHLVDDGDDDMRSCHATPDGFCFWGKPRGEGDTDET